MSDIDILLVRPPTLTAGQRELWVTQVHELRAKVQRWTGNRCQITDRPALSLRRLARAGEPVVSEWRRDAVHLAGAGLSQLLDQA